MKTNKELAVELTIAMIQASRKTAFSSGGADGNPIGGVSPPLSHKDVKIMLKDFYKSLVSLESNADENIPQE